ncbi:MULTISPECIES: type II toxin-antitoxin system VapC family toxin [unclassified Burkholderia]|uniref:type II toxin-antitoxin system VapC family toxin n=1 Tax=unclassified Burkholderia TaxID=2613784 RepID=UPI00158B9E5E|nr:MULTISPECIES: type II toxin-antitoxin system VapC family toxin [unclassified Burkholderia]
MIVLDTHALVWWAAGDPALSKKARSAIDRARGDSALVASAISAWEIAMLVRHERLVLTMDVDAWLATVAQIDGMRFVPIDADIAAKSASLPGTFHKDPADRMIVATARRLGAPLVTRDEKIRAYAHVKTLW